MFQFIGFSLTWLFIQRVLIAMNIIIDKEREEIWGIYISIVPVVWERKYVK